MRNETIAFLTIIPGKIYGKNHSFSDMLNNGVPYLYLWEKGNW
jgi:hypothetical protein